MSIKKSASIIKPNINHPSVVESINANLYGINVAVYISRIVNITFHVDFGGRFG
jgi:hypothetical protein